MSTAQRLTVAGGLIAVVVLLGVLVAAGWSPLLRGDTAVVDRVNEAVSPHPVQVDAWQTVTVVLGPVVLRVVALLLVVAAWWRGLRWEAVLVATAAVGGAVLSGGGKLIVDRPRPSPPVRLDEAISASFPSGHAVAVTLAAGIVVAAVVPRLHGAWRVVVVVLVVVVALAVGASRVALGVHYPSDVLAGWLLGAGWVLVALVVADRVCAPRPPVG